MEEKVKFQLDFSESKILIIFFPSRALKSDSEALRTELGRAVPYFKNDLEEICGT